MCRRRRRTHGGRAPRRRPRHGPAPQPGPNATGPVEATLGGYPVFLTQHGSATSDEDVRNCRRSSTRSTSKRRRLRYHVVVRGWSPPTRPGSNEHESPRAIETTFIDHRGAQACFRGHLKRTPAFIGGSLRWRGPSPAEAAAGRSGRTRSPGTRPRTPRRRRLRSGRRVPGRLRCQGSPSSPSGR